MSADGAIVKNFIFLPYSRVLPEHRIAMSMRERENRNVKNTAVCVFEGVRG